MGNHRLAIRDFERAIELFPKYMDAVFCLGVSKLKSKEIDEARKCFLKA
jgi:tetratricopeptide (TPR) repeat protein